MQPIRLVVIDDHQIVIDGLKAMLSRHAEAVEVVGEATDRETALAVVDGTDPDVVLLDVRLRGASGLDLCRELLRRAPQRRVVVLTVYDDEQYLFQALRLGAAGFLLKRVQGAELVGHLQQVVEGEIVIDATLAGRVAQFAARLHAGQYWPGAHLGLTQRESEVLSLVVAGLSNRAIAQKLVVSDETVKSHVRAVYRKLEVNERSQAVAVALREGIFS
ncbi:MAG: response regulator transcription factor [Propionibacteriales bacterium]|jgi:DNA-binding NarL/FixJ family response regulator|nr:response regulator transcription factor [Propionibacteriales bacterium]